MITEWHRHDEIWFKAAAASDDGMVPLGLGMTYLAEGVQRVRNVTLFHER